MTFKRLELFDNSGTETEWLWALTQPLGPVGTIYIDSLGLDAGSWEVELFVNTNPSTIGAGQVLGIALQHRNAANTANVHEWRLETGPFFTSIQTPQIYRPNIDYQGVYQQAQDGNCRVKFQVAQGERFRVVQFRAGTAALVLVSMSMMYRRFNDR